jgi:hypothetical protein
LADAKKTFHHQKLFSKLTFSIQKDISGEKLAPDISTTQLRKVWEYFWVLFAIFANNNHPKINLQQSLQQYSRKHEQ